MLLQTALDSDHTVRCSSYKTTKLRGKVFCTRACQHTAQSGDTAEAFQAVFSFKSVWLSLIDHFRARESSENQEMPFLGSNQKAEVEQEPQKTKEPRDAFT